MSAVVVPIRAQVKRFRQPDRDVPTIAAARMIRAACQTEPADDEQEAVLQAIAVSQAAKLPCSNLRCIWSTLDLRKDFDLRLADVRRAKAVRDAHTAEIAYIRARDGAAAAEEMFAEAERLFQLWRQATLDLARAPSPSRTRHAEKIKEIGRVWLNAPGIWYDQLRSAVQADVDQLAAAFPLLQRRGRA